MRISDWSSDVCSSDLRKAAGPRHACRIKQHTIRHVHHRVNDWSQFPPFGQTRLGAAIRPTGRRWFHPTTLRHRTSPSFIPDRPFHIPAFPLFLSFPAFPSPFPTLPLPVHSSSPSFPLLLSSFSSLLPFGTLF